MKLPSLTVAVKLWVPPYLVSLAIGCYVITLGLYWGFAWTQWWRVAEDGGRQVENRNVGVLAVFCVLGCGAEGRVDFRVLYLGHGVCDSAVYCSECYRGYFRGLGWPSLVSWGTRACVSGWQR